MTKGSGKLKIKIDNRWKRKVEDEGKKREISRSIPMVCKFSIEFETPRVEIRPNICRKCFGYNYDARLTKENHRKDCKLCNRPFRVSKWIYSMQFEMRSTEVCNKCSEAGKVCRCCGQACLEEEHGSVPIREREAAIPICSDQEREQREPSPLYSGPPLSYFC